MPGPGGGGRKLLFRTHGWIGLNCAFLMFLLALSGTFAVFSAELEWLADPVRRAASEREADRTPFSWQRTYDAASEIFPDGAVLRVFAPTGDGWTAMAAVSPVPGDIRLVYVDPGDYTVSGQRATFGIASFLRILHKQFYLVPTVVGFHGILIVGVLGILMLVSLLSGVVVFRRWWTAFVRPSFGTSPRAFWSDMHRALGVWALLATLTLSVTGAWYLAEYLLGEAGGLSEDAPKPRPSVDALGDMPQMLDRIDLDLAVARAAEVYPEMEVRQIALPVRPGDPLTLLGQAEAWFVRDRANQLYLEPAGNLRAVRRGVELPAFERWIEMADPIHFGDFGGLATRVLWCAAGIMLCAGIATGVYGVLLRLRKGGAAPPRWRGALALAPALAVSVAAVHGTWVYGAAQQRNSERPAAYRPLASFDVGPWRATALQLIRDGRPGNVAVLRFSEGGYPNLTGAQVWTGAEGPAADARPPRLYADRIIAPVDLSSTCAIPCRLFVRLIASDGRHFETSVAIDPPAGDFAQDTAGVRSVPPVPPLPAGVVGVIAAFCLTAAVPGAAWIYVLLYRRQRIGQRPVVARKTRDRVFTL